MPFLFITGKQGIQKKQMFSVGYQLCFYAGRKKGWERWVDPILVRRL